MADRGSGGLRLPHCVTMRRFTVAVCVVVFLLAACNGSSTGDGDDAVEQYRKAFVARSGHPIEDEAAFKRVVAAARDTCDLGDRELEEQYALAGGQRGYFRDEVKAFCPDRLDDLS